MQVTEFLIKVVERTDGWVIVVVFLLYVVYHIYKKHSEGVALTKTLDILENTLSSLLKNIESNVSTLTAKIDAFISRKEAT